MFVSPMLASAKFPKNETFHSDEWFAEEKIDGHRLIVEVSEGAAKLFVEKGITAWSRYGNVRELPTHLLEELAKFPDGIYDGELYIPGKRSYGVTELVNGPELEFHIFDLIQLTAEDFIDLPYETRRGILERVKFPWGNSVKLLPSTPVDTWEQVEALRDEVWERDGEGLILKRKSGLYRIGKRSKDLVKIKALRHASLTVTGFMPSRGQINNRGPFGMIVLRDDDGNITSVGTKNTEELRHLESMAHIIPHPMIGKKLVVKYQERTPDGSYRHVRFDHWE